jgi:acetate kinase
VSSPAGDGAGHVLVLNCGSSSIKYRLFDGASTAGKGIIEEIGGDIAGFEAALYEIMGSVDLSGLVAVGHRVVHGGSAFTAPTVIDDEVVATIEGLVPLAPLHNPAALAGIAVARKLLPDVPQVAVFDTAFHATIPPEGTTFAIDVSLAQRWAVRRYGFHGTSHAYVARRTGEFLGLDPTRANVVTLHLGNGASACAVAGGRSVATSMGLSPQGGLVMGTRSGDIDPTVVFHLHRVAGLPIDEIEQSLTRYAGLRGLAGESDMRQVQRRRAAGDPAATLAFEVYCRRIKEYVGAYMAVLGRTDAITFTAGVGENSAAVRTAALAGLEPLGIAVDEARNEQAAADTEKGPTLISPDDGRIAVCVVPTDEELEIATQSRAALNTPST